ncbi:unnamed protein product [Effrenium voratum]|uniref:Major facilitator superfamily (MFS) profile domain-containing protein n=1 Tax=Effrenium voratum TaxID=2562239 RepID=A0AA36J071_9DINO|nr:unnamed protein product [Effrenium voratum]
MASPVSTGGACRTTPQAVGASAEPIPWREHSADAELGHLVTSDAEVSLGTHQLPLRKWLGITAYQMVYVCLKNTGMGVLVLPLEAERFHQENPSIWVGVYMGVSGSTQLICPVIGKLSDQHRSSWGKRRPFILSGTLLAVLGLVAMRLASLQLLPWVFLASLLFQQLAVNSVYAAQCGLPADFLGSIDTPSGSEKAVVSGLVAMYTFLGSLLAMAITIITSSAPVQTQYLIYTAAMIVACCVVCSCATETSSLQSASTPLTFSDLRKSFVIDVRKDSDFFWVCAGRLCYYMSTSIATFMYYYFRDMMHVEDEARRKKVIGVLAIIMQCVGMLTSVPLGRLSNRLGRKPMIYISCLFMVCTFILYVLAPLVPSLSWTAVVAAAVLYGVGSGAYLSVDYALALDCLPEGKSSAEALGLWGVVGFFGSTLGPILGGYLLSLAGDEQGVYPFLGYALVMLVLGCGMTLMVMLLTRNIRSVR